MNITRKEIIDNYTRDTYYFVDNKYNNKDIYLYAFDCDVKKLEKYENVEIFKRTYKKSMTMFDYVVIIHLNNDRLESDEQQKFMTMMYNLSKYCSYEYTYCSGMETSFLTLHVDVDCESKDLTKIIDILQAYNKDILELAEFTTNRKDNSIEIRIDEI
jgi:hypothetical protein